MTAGRKINSFSTDWGTPSKYVNVVKEFFDGNIDLDPCSNKFSIVHAGLEYSLPERDGLTHSWSYHRVYVNPPYGRDKENGTSIKDWLRKCSEANKTYDSQVLALIPVATNTSHWKQYIYGHATAVCFLYDTRLRFLVRGQDTGKGAPMACALVYWGANLDRFKEVFQKHGAIFTERL